MSQLPADTMDVESQQQADERRRDIIPGFVTSDMQPTVQSCMSPPDDAMLCANINALASILARLGPAPQH